MDTRTLCDTHCDTHGYMAQYVLRLLVHDIACMAVPAMAGLRAARLQAARHRRLGSARPRVAVGQVEAARRAALPRRHGQRGVLLALLALAGLSEQRQDSGHLVHLPSTLVGLP